MNCLDLVERYLRVDLKGWAPRYCDIDLEDVRPWDQRLVADPNCDDFYYEVEREAAKCYAAWVNFVQLCRSILPADQIPETLKEIMEFWASEESHRWPLQKRWAKE